MDSRRFDELTKALATSTSRRQALRRLAGILGGTALAGLFPGLASASNSTCAHFCDTVFGANTPAASQCTSDAAHGKGLCYTCGPASPGGTKPICCPGGSGHCTSYSSATCCTSNQTCQADGTCQTCVSQCDEICSDTSPCCPGLQCCVIGLHGEGYCCSVCNGLGFCTDPGC